MQRTEGLRATRILKKEWFRRGELSQTLSLAPQHYRLLLFISHHMAKLPPEERPDLFSNERSSRPGWSCSLFSHITGQRSLIIFVHSTSLFGFLYLAPRFYLNSGMFTTFISDLLYCFFTCHILAQMREYGLGKDLFQNVWVVALELAGDMLQLVLQVYGDILAGSFQGES